MSTESAVPWLGSLQVDFHRDGPRTTLSRSFATAPLAVSRAFYPDGPDTCHVMMLHNAGGMVGGDELAIEGRIGPEAKATLTTASAGKVYRSTGARTRQQVTLQVAEGASVAWVPQETILFDGAAYRQDLTVDLADDATYLGWDLVRYGRTARGERFLNGSYRSHTTVTRNGRPLWLDRQRLDGGTAALDSPQGLAGQPVVGTLVWIGGPLDATLIEQVRDAWTALGADGEAGVTAVAAGLVCRYRGPATGTARRWFADVWALVAAAGAPVTGERRELPACTRLR